MWCGVGACVVWVLPRYSLAISSFKISLLFLKKNVCMYPENAKLQADLRKVEEVSSHASGIRL